MFNWLKNKLNNLLPNDINKGFATSNFVTIKVGDKITIPENIVCFISFHDKIYAELKTGTYSLDENLLPNLYTKQKKKRKNLKKFNLDLFFVNLNSQNIKLSYVDKIPIKNKTTKLIFEMETTINVIEAKIFNKFICAEFYQPLALTANNFISDFIEEFTKKYFLKIKLEDNLISQNVIDDVNEKLKKSLTKIGLNLKYFKLSTSYKNEPNKKRVIYDTNSTTPITIEEKQEKSLNLVDQTEKFNYNLNEPKPQNTNVCPVCGSKIIKGSIFCPRCGNLLR